MPVRTQSTVIADACARAMWVRPVCFWRKSQREFTMADQPKNAPQPSTPQQQPQKQAAPLGTPTGAPVTPIVEPKKS